MSTAKFVMKESQWRKIQQAHDLPAIMRSDMDQIGSNYLFFFEEEQRRKPSSLVRSKIKQIAAVAQKLASLLNNLEGQDVYEILTSAGIKRESERKLSQFEGKHIDCEINAREATRFESLQLLQNRIRAVESLKNWCDLAENAIERERPGAHIALGNLHWLIRSFAYIYWLRTRKPFINDQYLRQLLGDFLQMLGPAITERTLGGAIDQVIEDMSRN